MLKYKRVTMIKKKINPLFKSFFFLSLVCTSYYDKISPLGIFPPQKGRTNIKLRGFYEFSKTPFVFLCSCLSSVICGLCLPSKHRYFFLFILSFFFFFFFFGIFYGNIRTSNLLFEGLMLGICITCVNVVKS